MTNLLGFHLKNDNASLLLNILSFLLIYSSKIQGTCELEILETIDGGNTTNGFF